MRLIYFLFFCFLIACNPAQKAEIEPVPQLFTQLSSAESGMNFTNQLDYNKDFNIYESISDYEQDKGAHFTAYYSPMLHGSKIKTKVYNNAIYAKPKKRSLVKIGVGLYARVRVTRYSDRPIIVNGFSNAALEALERLGVTWQLGRNTRAYNEGLSQQVPVFTEIRLKDRCRRQFEKSCGTIIFEDGINAR